MGKPAGQWCVQCSTPSTVTSQNFGAEVDRSGTQTLHGYGAAVATPHGLATAAAMAIIAQAETPSMPPSPPTPCSVWSRPRPAASAEICLPWSTSRACQRPDVLNSSGRAGPGPTRTSCGPEAIAAMPAFDPHTVTVPGCVDGWEALAGRATAARELSAIVAPAIALATQGFPASVELVAALTRRPELARQDAGSGALIREASPRWLESGCGGPTWQRRSEPSPTMAAPASISVRPARESFEATEGAITTSRPGTRFRPNGPSRSGGMCSG